MRDIRATVQSRSRAPQLPQGPAIEARPSNDPRANEGTRAACVRGTRCTRTRVAHAYAVGAARVAAQQPRKSMPHPTHQDTGSEDSQTAHNPPPHAPILRTSEMSWGASAAAPGLAASHRTPPTSRRAHATRAPALPNLVVETSRALAPVHDAHDNICYIKLTADCVCVLFNPHPFVVCRAR